MSSSQLKRNDYSLLRYYADFSVSKATHQLIRNLPAFISNDPTEYCHYYVEPNINSIPRKTSNIKNTRKYASRSQKMLNLSKTANNLNKNEELSQNRIHYSTTISMLKTTNPSITIIKEDTLTNIIKPMIDTRCDRILNQNHKHKDEISYFLMDKDGVFNIDQGYHIKNVEQFHFGGDYGPNYQGSLFVDPEKYKLHKLQKEINKNNHNNNIPIPKQTEKVCHGCRTKYFVNEWETHIKTDAHQRYLSDPGFIEFNEYINALNQRLKNKNMEKKEQEDDDDCDEIMLPTNNRLPDIMEVEENEGNKYNEMIKLKSIKYPKLKVFDFECEDFDTYAYTHLLEEKQEDDKNDVLQEIHYKNVTQRIKRKRKNIDCNELCEPQKKKRKISDSISIKSETETFVFDGKLESIIEYPKLIFDTQDFEENMVVLNEELNGVNTVKTVKGSRQSARLRRKRSRRSSLGSLPNNNSIYKVIDEDKFKREKRKEERDEYCQRMRNNNKKKRSCLNDIFFGEERSNGSGSDECCLRGEFEYTSVPVCKGVRLVRDLYVKCNKCKQVYCLE